MISQNLKVSHLDLFFTEISKKVQSPNTGNRLEWLAFFLNEWRVVKTYLLVFVHAILIHKITLLLIFTDEIYHIFAASLY